MSVKNRTFDELVNEALDTHFSGWDFSFLNGRTEAEPLPWSYEMAVREAMNGVGSMLDIGTGGGEVLASLAPFPPHTCATEGYEPNVPVARERLEPLGVKVVQAFSQAYKSPLPFSDGEFELVIDRHEAFYAQEIMRLLRPGGQFITQQVGGMNFVGLNKWLQGEDAQPPWPWWNLEYQTGQLQTAGFMVLDAQEAFPKTTFLDIGAVVYYLRVVPWQVEDFTVEDYRDRLLSMHEHILETGGLTVEGHRFYVRAQKP